MSKAEEYRAKAREAEAMAKAAPNTRLRDGFQRIATAFTRLAEEAERRETTDRNRSRGGDKPT